jgi:hypothetical protein
MNFADNM